MNIAFYTLGCKVNQYETQVIREEFEKRGDLIVAPTEKADVYIINSCTVTGESDRKTRQILRHFRKENENSIIVLTGCMVQVFFEDSKNLLEADIVVGNKNPSSIPLLVDEFLKTGERILKSDPHQKGEIYCTPAISNFENRTRAFLKIEDGCDRYCSYCIIPKARGFVRSKSLEEIEKEATVLAQKGFTEIVLVGINLSAYGKGTAFNICDAVSKVCSVEKVKRVRLGSIEPDHISDEMLLRFKEEEKFCPQFHLSLQSGCDATLKRMNRHYDSAFYKDLVKRIRNLFENAAITTDIMVGFAGETEEEFKESLDFVKEIGFSSAHVFAYSRRCGTVAYSLKNQVSKKEKHNRSKLMIEATTESEKKFLGTMMGRSCEVLFESAENGYIYGYTSNYCRVKVKNNTNLCGQLKKVNIVSLEDLTLIGEI